MKPAQTQPTQAVTKAEERFTEFVPFGAQDKVKLSIAMVKNLIAVKTKTGKTCSDNDAMKFIAMCLARRLNPFEGDAFLIGYDNKDGTATFSLITAHQAFLKRAELNPEYDGMKSGLILERNGEIIDSEGDFYLKDDKLMGGWATVFFKNRKQPMHKRIRLERFKRPFGIWLEDAAGMICKCAEADALRSSFPTMLGGLHLKEEMNLPVEQPKGATPIFTSPPPAIEAPAVKEEKPKPRGESKADVARKLYESEGINETTVVEFVNQMGFSDGGEIKSLDEAPDDALDRLIKQSDSVIEHIKEAQS